MIVYKKGAFTITLVMLISFSFGQLFKKEINRYDEQGKRTGLWIDYWDSIEKVIASKARFRDGHETGVSKHYHPNGNIRLKWRYYKNRIRAKYYFEDGKLEQKGWSKIEWAEADTHYYWHGTWKFYDEHGKLIRKAFYQNGEEITNREFEVR